MPSSTNPGFNQVLENQVKTILMDYVGLGGIYSDPTLYIQTWDNKVPDFDINTDVPICIVRTRQARQQPKTSIGAEIGTARELWNWFVDIYYLDVEQSDYDAGRYRQGNFVDRIRNALENEPTLRNCKAIVNPTSPLGAQEEKVYNNDWSDVSFDDSGQEGYWTFVSVLNVTVQTSRN